ncbi:MULTISPECIES: amino acid ABC transporter permease [unclassified Rhizobium]|uniref:amino acid ABC transporter permease n=1 Tax=unclassified Rhizobium TaxID=2613769 RepID=UPI001AD9AF86|nr:MULTISPECIES: amino acid ABC transporter permease [unclassified Rhizobium]MBO9100629.1 amino acid ABC transporter permease [Rhizobium sp. L58/93]MBO9136009.1 amino acid ABC transporter permease [Rhizobium sp. B209b/85]MBO9171321.1 amino acid ABC transporter permease [Rhizobium sp. L245/93]MBO9187188.1 amino acid ABC transporter permease [Rhizobium sp. E27B/91]QXZ87875.1 amino acid ABC transporter permease [Rhizobium sp. K1/93]
MSHSFLEQLWIARYVIVSGLMMTISISLLAIVAGSVVGVFVGLALAYGNMALRFVVRAYADIIRGTPVLVLVLASYYVSSAVGLDLGPFSAGVLALAIFCSSHVGEIVRGALQAIPRGQTEAAKAIGLTFTQTFTSVLWPQALRQCLPAWVNTAAEIVKASTLLSVIGVAELLLRSQEIISRNFMSLQFYFLAGALYFVVNFGIERFGKFVERKTMLPS